MAVVIIVAWINFVISIIIISLIFASIIKLREIKHMFYITLAFATVAVLFVVHAAIEVWNFGANLYALTALIATILLGYAIIVLRIKSSMSFEGKSK